MWDTIARVRRLDLLLTAEKSSQAMHEFNLSQGNADLIPTLHRAHLDLSFTASGKQPDASPHKCPEEMECSKVTQSPLQLAGSARDVATDGGAPV
jgi:hypothetical protein